MKVEIKGHTVLGDLTLDFCDPDGNPFNTIILAGENGCGKTVILETIHSLFEWKFPKELEMLRVDIQLDQSNISGLRKLLEASLLTLENNILRIQYNRNLGANSASDYEITWKSDTGDSYKRDYNSFAPKNAKAVLRSYLSEAGINYHFEPIRSISAKSIDQTSSTTTRTSKTIASDIAQLLVDLRQADSEDLARWVEANPGSPPPSSVIARRMKRFQEAFYQVFPNKRLKDIKRSNNEIHIVFSEHGRESTLEQLSTGEKQIVFRGGFLLRDIDGMQGGIILIDEPELSLHPSWQKEIVGFYQRILDCPERKTSQLLIATHSPFIVHEAPNSKTIILEKDHTSGQIQVMTRPEYPSLGRDEIIQAFNIERLFDLTTHDLVLLVEGDSDAAIIREAWRKLYPNKPIFFEVRPALGAKNINITLNDSTVFHHTKNRKIIGLFDFDDAYNHWKGVWHKNAIQTEANPTQGITKRHTQENGWAMLLPVPNYRSNYANANLGGRSILSIEFMFDDVDIPSEFMTEIPIAGTAATQKEFKKDKKNEFAQLVRAWPPQKFEAFIPLFEKLHAIHAEPFRKGHAT